MPAIASNIKRLGNNKIRALFSLELPSGAILNSCLLTYDAKANTYKVLPPQIPAVDERGALKLSAKGETIFVAAVSFRSSRTRRHFEQTALVALRAAATDLFLRR